MADQPTNDIPRARKAAMIVQLTLGDGGDLPLSSLSEDEQLRLTRELGALKLVDKPTLDRVAAEFAQELGNVAMTVPGSVEEAISTLDGKISAGALQKLREEAVNKEGADPWSQILGLDNDGLLAVLRSESIEIGAVVLAKLPTARAAELLGKLPGDQARRIAYSVSRTAGILPAAVSRIGQALAQQYCSGAAPAFLHPPSQRVGAILNSSSSDMRDRLLRDLSAEDAEFAEDVRKSIFTFADIPERLIAVDVPKILRDIPPEDLVAALAYAQSEGGPLAPAADHLLENMSKRMADSLRDEIAEMGTVKKADGEAAQASVITVIRAADDSGQITLLTKDDED